LAGRATGWGIDLAAELQNRRGAGEVIRKAGAEEIFAASKNEGGAAGAMFSDLAERGFYGVSGEERA
jgi:hypothetical protein